MTRSFSTGEILQAARRSGYAVGAFEVWNLESVQAVIAAAEAERMPVILQAGPLEIQHAGLRELAAIARRAIERAKVPATLHLDHGDTLELVRQCADAGFDSIMLDASHLPYRENVTITKGAVRIAHAAGLSAEGEIGRVGGTVEGTGIDGNDEFLTDPQEARRYVEETGVDFLAVAIGTKHGLYKKPCRLDINRLEKIGRLVNVPLVLHGGSYTPEPALREVIRLGIAKVNICTEFVECLGKSFHEAYVGASKRNVTTLFSPAKTAGELLVRKKMRLFALRDGKKEKREPYLKTGKSSLTL